MHCVVYLHSAHISSHDAKNLFRVVQVLTRLSACRYGLRLRDRKIWSAPPR